MPKVPNCGFSSTYRIDFVSLPYRRIPMAVDVEKSRKINGQSLKTALLTSNARPGLNSPIRILRLETRMTDPLPIVCIPGLACSPRLYAEQIPQLWTVGPVTIAQHARHESVGAIVRSILASAPERFALIGLSMGGYVSFEIMRQAPRRVAKLALLDTTARPDTL
jgi:pimeloyl-ACP methyl ester carboxylesterase